MYAEKRFDQVAPPVHFLDGFIEYLYANIEKTYIYNDGGDCLNCRYQRSLGRGYTPPGTVNKFNKPSSEWPSRVIETIASDAAPIYNYGKLDRVGTYRAALEIAEYVRKHDAWPQRWE